MPSLFHIVDQIFEIFSNFVLRWMISINDCSKKIGFEKLKGWNCVRKLSIDDLHVFSALSLVIEFRVSCSFILYQEMHLSSYFSKTQNLKIFFGSGEIDVFAPTIHTISGFPSTRKQTWCCFEQQFSRLSLLFDRLVPIFKAQCTQRSLRCRHSSSNTVKSRNKNADEKWWGEYYWFENFYWTSSCFYPKKIIALPVSVCDL